MSYDLPLKRLSGADHACMDTGKIMLRHQNSPECQSGSSHKIVIFIRQVDRRVDGKRNLAGTISFQISLLATSICSSFVENDEAVETLHMITKNLKPSATTDLQRRPDSLKVSLPASSSYILLTE